MQRDTACNGAQIIAHNIQNYINFMRIVDRASKT